MTNHIGLFCILEPTKRLSIYPGGSRDFLSQEEKWVPANTICLVRASKLGVYMSFIDVDQLSSEEYNSKWKGRLIFNSLKRVGIYEI